MKTMQGYGAAFARVYNLLWAGFARELAPKIFEFYTHTEIASQEQTLLDVCCGTGQLSLYFLEHGYRVTGLDLSEAMLEHARENASMFVKAGQARFVQGNAASFALDEQFGLCVSTFDALNHLPNIEALRGCFESVYRVTLPGGYFIFDLNTALGLKRWNSISVQESDEAVVINRGIYDGGEKAYTRISGFLRENGEDRNGNECYLRFEETVYNTVFRMADVHAALIETGWSEAYFARASDLAAAVADPEQESRAFVVARR
jgi:SAM-dependent methyltransferase